MNASTPTPVELSQLVIRKTKYDLERSSCGFKVTDPIVAEHLAVSTSMIRKIRRGEKEFGRITFNRLARSAKQTLGDYIVDLLKWSIIEAPHLRADDTPEPRGPSVIADDVGDAFLNLDKVFSNIRKGIRLREWDAERYQSGDCRADDPMETVMVIFRAVAQFVDLVSVRLMKSAAVIFQRRDRYPTDTFGYGIRRDYRCGEWETLYLTNGDITAELSRDIVGAWSKDYGGQAWLHAREVCVDVQRTAEKPRSQPFFSTHDSSDRSDRILVRAVHEQFHPTVGSRACVDSTRTTLILRFTEDDSPAITHVAERLADRLVDMMEYVRLRWIQDIASIRSLTDAELSKSLRFLPRDSLSRGECEQRVEAVGSVIQLALSRYLETKRKRGRVAGAMKLASDALLRKLLAFDFWVYDTYGQRFHSHGADGFAFTMPASKSLTLVDSRDGCRRDYESAYLENVAELKPSGVGGKSMACIAKQCFLNVDRDFEAGAMKKTVRLLEKGNQVGIPFDLVEEDESGDCRRRSHAIAWFRFHGKHPPEAIIDFVSWVDQVTRLVGGVRIRIRGVERGSYLTGRTGKLERSEIAKALDTGEAVLKEYVLTPSAEKLCADSSDGRGASFNAVTVGK